MMRMTKNLTIIFLLSFLNFQARSQKIDTINLDGNEYFVYPFKVELDVHSMYHKCLGNQPLELLYRDYMETAEELTGEKLSYAEFKKMMRKFRRKSSGYNTYGADSKKLKKKFIQAVRANPYPLIEARYSFDQDVIPVLDSIPDGKYVQLFEPFCLMKGKDGCEMQEECIAGYFTIKNNMLDGYACWVNAKGDTLKAGNFEQGQKVGKWKLEFRYVSYTLYDSDMDQYVELGYPMIDTSLTYQEFAYGSENGRYQFYKNTKYPIEEGYFKDGERTGEWISREPDNYNDYYYYDFPTEFNRNNNVVTLRYTLAGQQDTNVIRKVWIREELYEPYDYNYEEFNFFSEYGLPDLYVDFFRMNIKEDENLDLDEEDYNSYGEDEYGDFGYYDYGEYDWGYYDDEGDYITRAKMIDSLGMIPNYVGEYEVRYPNGQLAYRYNLSSDAKVWEDTIFWSNGQPFDIIVHDPDSNRYLRSTYDLNGKLFEVKVYDSIGEFSHYEMYQDNFEMIEIEGLEVYEYKGAHSMDYSYYNYDTLMHDPVGHVILERSWDYMLNRTFNSEYDADNRVKRDENYSLLHTIPITYEYIFGEDFTNWTGKGTSTFGNLQVHETISGSEYDFSNYLMYDMFGAEEDSVPERYIIEDPYRSFEIASESELHMNGEPYSGEVQITFGGKKIKTDAKKLKMNFPFGLKAQEYQSKVLLAYESKGKVKDETLLAFATEDQPYYTYSTTVFYTLFEDLLEGYFRVPNEYDYMYGLEGNRNNNDNNAVRIEGYMINGQPSGVWRSFDKKGRILTEVPFNDGLIDGKVRMFEVAQPQTTTSHYEYAILDDSLPSQPTYYLARSSEYRNGKMHGVSRSFNWLGQIMSEEKYEDDFLHGEIFERNRLAYSKAKYRNGALNGYMQTYLTLKDQDTILLYDLNFKDNQLQGESKAYHLNGKLAKRGFFLDGSPIEDYEAFDTLGFRYHYVKFQYSFPVEEKVWEENKLSVRYTFDWEDSIYFSPDDITSSQSLERLIFKLGLAGYRTMAPYTGRPTLVDKSGVQFHMTKYYPNDSIARDGDLDAGKKKGPWKFWDYYGKLMYEVDYADSIIVLNDSIKFKSKGILTELDDYGNPLYKAYIIEKFEKYDCSHTDHYEIRQFMTFWEVHDSVGRMNGYVKNHYDNGTIQSEGQMKNGLPDGVWKYYDPFGALNKVGVYTMGKRDGRWLSGDLSKTKYLGDICLNPNLPDLEEEIAYRENLLDISITNYKMGKVLNSQYYDVNMNRFIEEEGATESLDEE